MIGLSATALDVDGLVRTVRSDAHGAVVTVLDTAQEEGAAGLYERMGFKLTGVIPDYALKPHDGLTGTLIYWKRLRDAESASSTQSAE